jgi:hypothetical protein
MIVALKVLFLFIGLAYACPVIIGGAIQKHRVTQGQVFWCVGGLVGFVTLQWMI